MPASICPAKTGQYRTSKAVPIAISVFSVAYQPQKNTHSLRRNLVRQLQWTLACDTVGKQNTVHCRFGSQKTPMPFMPTLMSTFVPMLINAKCQMPNAKCQMPNAKCQMPNAKCQMPNNILKRASELVDSHGQCCLEQPEYLRLAGCMPERQVGCHLALPLRRCSRLLERLSQSILAKASCYTYTYIHTHVHACVDMK